MATGARFLAFRCTRCGNCCKSGILLPLTDRDLLRIVGHTGDAARDVVRWVDDSGIDMGDEPEWFIELRQGRRVMVLRQQRGQCRYLGETGCTIYRHRPLGCRIYPFEPEYTRKGRLRRLALTNAVECPYELDGDNDIDALRRLNERYTRERDEWLQRIAVWNRAQQRRKRAGKAPETSGAFLRFIGAEPELDAAAE